MKNRIFCSSVGSLITVFLLGTIVSGQSYGAEIACNPPPGFHTPLGCSELVVQDGPAVYVSKKLQDKYDVSDWLAPGDCESKGYISYGNLQVCLDFKEMGPTNSSSSNGSKTSGNKISIMKEDGNYLIDGPYVRCEKGFFPESTAPRLCIQSEIDDFTTLNIENPLDCPDSSCSERSFIVVCDDKTVDCRRQTGDTFAVEKSYKVCPPGSEPRPFTTFVDPETELTACVTQYYRSKKRRFQF